jgi:hypothetical protein
MSERDNLPKKPVVRLLLKSCGNKVIFLFVFFPLDLTYPRSLRNFSFLPASGSAPSQEGIGANPSLKDNVTDNLSPLVGCFSFSDQEPRPRRSSLSEKEKQ